uniref:Major facilitator superfamily (MFS) profile domain-containing protein n=1 Tax=Kwoniella bestiolae CBS 10118 TaxID=1296100 RepID=A0A1B9FS96_9TREE|nr:hypothetical protein I302_08405 [Kwoniella bestiolae CBS 10118]OCF21630.1 hypothetical protein I302_08405 [Kwoniella bestiolae CBS 10118]
MRNTEKELVDQAFRPTGTRFVFIFCTLQLLLFLAFVDQFCVSTVLPFIGESLGVADRISWVGTAAIVTTIGSQMIVARCSDIFGRRSALTAILLIFIFGNLMCGFAQNAIWLFTCRGLSGIGAGGIISLTMVCVADIVPVRQRGKLQGYTGFTVALGSGMGPLIGAAMASKISWRWAFWITPPFLALAIPILYFAFPNFKKPREETTWHQLKKVDYLGSLLLFAGSILILVPISGGGSIFPWKSATCIILVILGLLLIVAFLAVERYQAIVPILPTRLFHHRDVNLILLATATHGWIYYGTMFFSNVPQLYLQEVLGVSALRAGVLLLPMVFSQGLGLGLAGKISTKFGYIVPQMQFGYALGLAGCGLMYRFDIDTSTGYIVGILFLVGFAAGCTLQTTLVTMQNTAPEDLRAIITGARNTFRSFGGSIGLAAAGPIRNSVISSALLGLPSLSDEQRQTVVSLGPSAILDELDLETRTLVLKAMRSGIQAVFLSFLPLMAVSLIAVVFVKQKRLANEDYLTDQNENLPPVPIVSSFTTDEELGRMELQGQSGRVDDIDKKA